MNTVISTLSSSLLFDACERLNVPCTVLDLAIKPLDATHKLYGPVFTLKGISNVSDDQKRASKDFFDVLPRGAVLIIDTGRTYGIGHWGELMSHGAIAHGIVGVVVDGGCRDIDAMRKLDFPVFCKNSSPRESGNAYCIGEWACQIQMPSHGGEMISVDTGDYVFGDSDGVLLFRSDAFDAVVQQASVIQEMEKATIESIRQGVRVADAFQRHEVA